MNDTITTRTVTNEATPAPDKESLEVFLDAPAARPWYRRPAYIAAAAGLLLVLLLLSRCFAGEAAGGYATEPVRRGNLTVTVSATGNLQPTNQVEVGSEQSGLVERVYVDNNDRVAAGQPLARLDTSRLQDTIIQAQAGLTAAQAQVATAQATAAQARANLARQEEVFRLSGGQVPSETELDAARAESRRAMAQVRAAEAQVAQSRAQVSSAQTNLSKATIYSPVTGVVLSRQIDPGQTVAASFQAPVLFTIAEDLTAMELQVRVDEADVGQVEAGQRASFTVDAWPGRTFDAVVQRVDVGANASDAAAAGSATGSVVAYTAILSVQNPDLVLRPGMTATAEIVTTERRNVLLVPNAALRFSPERAAGDGERGGVTSVLVPRRGFRRGNRAEREVSIGRGSRQTVYVLGADGEPQPVRIVVGETNGSQTEVVGGDLSEGMEVITARLAPGQAQQKEERRGARNRQDGGGRGERAVPGNAASPEPAAPAREAAQPRTEAAQPEAKASAPAETPPPAGERPRLRDMTPEQRRAYRESLTPEQRAQMRERRQRRKAQPADAPDAE